MFSVLLLWASRDLFLIFSRQLHDFWGWSQLGTEGTVQFARVATSNLA